MRATEFLNEIPAAGNFGNRVWYHGTSKSNYKKILKSKMVKPFLADNYEVGKAIWLTSDPEEAREFGPVVIAINNKDAMKFKRERWSGFSYGTIKKYKEKPDGYHMIIKEPVPIKYWKLYDGSTVTKEALDLNKLVSDPTKLKTHGKYISPKEAYQRLKKGEKDEYLIHAIAKDAKYSYKYAKDVLKKPFPLGEPAIAKDAWYSIIYAYHVLKNKPFPLGEPAIATDAWISYLYAKNILEKPFPLGEPAIATSGVDSYHYAKDVLKKPFPLGEPAIYRTEWKKDYETYVLKGQPWTGLEQKVDEALDLYNLVSDPTKLKTHGKYISPQEAYERLKKGEKDENLLHAVAKDAMYSYKYANYVLEKPFPSGEPAIAKDPWSTYRYAYDVLKGPFPSGEPAIAKDAIYSYYYAKDILQKPFPLGEPAIAKDDFYSYLYEKNVLKGRPWTGLEQKVDEALDPDFKFQVDRMLSMNWRGAVAEDILLKKFYRSNVYDSEAKGEDWINIAATWLESVKDYINKEHPELDLSDLDQLAYNMYISHISKNKLTEDLRKWFKEKWVRFGPDGKIRGSCARGKKSEGKPKCLPQSKAHSLGKKGRASAAARKRRQDPNPERKGKAKNVATKSKRDKK